MVGKQWFCRAAHFLLASYSCLAVPFQYQPHFLLHKTALWTISFKCQILKITTFLPSSSPVLPDGIITLYSVLTPLALRLL
jgi:hypothetical protein